MTRFDHHTGCAFWERHNSAACDCGAEAAHAALLAIPRTLADLHAVLTKIAGSLALIAERSER